MEIDIESEAQSETMKEKDDETEALEK